MLAIKITGFLFVVLAAIGWLPRYMRELFRQHPAPIIRLAYFAMTIYAIVLGVGIIYHSALEQSVSRYLETIFIQGQAAPDRLPVVLAAVIISLCFVLANLSRSYYSLHRIEDDDTYVIRKLLGLINGKLMLVETFLRIGMFVAIMFLIQVIQAIHAEIPDSGSLLVVGVFRYYFKTFWLWLGVYYILLLGWDATIWFTNRRITSVDSNVVLTILYWQAIPVHLSGFIVALMVILPTYMSPLSRYVDWFYLAALFAALCGSAFLFGSLLFDSRSLWRRLRIIKNKPHREQEVMNV